MLFFFSFKTILKLLNVKFKSKTVKNLIEFTGIGLHSGKTAKLSIKPAEPNTGIIFKRTDLNSNNTIFPNFKM